MAQEPKKEHFAISISSLSQPSHPPKKRESHLHLVYDMKTLQWCNVPSHHQVAQPIADLPATCASSEMGPFDADLCGFWGSLAIERKLGGGSNSS